LLFGQEEITIIRKFHNRLSAFKLVGNIVVCDNHSSNKNTTYAAACLPTIYDIAASKIASPEHTPDKRRKYKQNIDDK